MNIDPSIFKAYDIRGVVGESLTLESVRLIGKAIGSEAINRNNNPICVGRDGRLSGPEIVESLVDGLLSTGVEIIDIGRVTSPILYYATHELKTGNGIMVTGSHNPPDYNGFKIVIDGNALFGEQIQNILSRINQGEFKSGNGKLSQTSVNDEYVKRITTDIKIARPMKISIDCGNGVAGDFASDVYQELGITTSELYCEVDGTFPNHHPDPSKPENLQDLMQDLALTESEIGLAFDGDGDRLGVVTKQGQVIYSDKVLMLFADDLLSREKNAEIVYDVKCTGALSKWIKDRGGHPKMYKTGHSLIKAEMKRSNSLLGGEMSGHFFFLERWFGFDDGIYAGARLLEYLSHKDSISETFDQLPQTISTPEIQISCDEGENFKIIKKLQNQGIFPFAKEKIKIDGVRAEYSDGFGLARASNTTPTLVLRFEANSDIAIDKIVSEFRSELRAIDSNIDF